MLSACDVPMRMLQKGVPTANFLKSSFDSITRGNARLDSAHECGVAVLRCILGVDQRSHTGQRTKLAKSPDKVTKPFFFVISSPGSEKSSLVPNRDRSDRISGFIPLHYQEWNCAITAMVKVRRGASEGK